MSMSTHHLQGALREGLRERAREQQRLLFPLLFQLLRLLQGHGARLGVQRLPQRRAEAQLVVDTSSI